MSYEEGDGVAFLKMSAAGEIQIMPATVVRMLDEYRALIRFAGGQEITYPVDQLTPMPQDSSY